MRHVLFVHGMFMTGLTFAPWMRWFEERRWSALAPSWPGRDGTPEAARKQPDPALRSLTLSQLVDQFEAVARGLPRPPLLVGHSMGGLVVQLLLQRGIGAAAVVLGSAPPHGVRSFAWSHLRANSAVLWPSSAPIVPSFSWFRYAFLHTGPEEVARQAFVDQIVPESREVGRGPLRPESKIDFTRPRAPLLFLSGELDRIIPPALNRRNAARYRPEAGLTEWEVVPGRTHFLANQPGWETLAERTLAFADGAGVS